MSSLLNVNNHSAASSTFVDAQVGLPFGWKRKMSRSKGVPYYVTPTGETQWKCPQIEQAVPHGLCDTWKKTMRAVWDSHMNAEMRFCKGIHPNDRTWNTLCYLFHHCRACIYCRIESGCLVSFIPFCNGLYTNNWPDVRIRPGATTGESRHRGFLDNTKLWWSNGGTVGCIAKVPVWGSSFVEELIDFLKVIAPRVGNAEWFLNKRDHPLLRKDRREPYAEPFLPNDPPSIMVANWTYYAKSPFDSFCPILSFYTNGEYEDLPFPVAQDIVPQPQITAVPWENKMNLPIFRGSASGYGVTVETNVRLALAKMGARHPDKYDFRLTTWNRRLKFQPDGTVACIRPQDFPFRASKEYYMPMANQGTYKYLVYCDGNVGASRLGFLLSVGSLVIVIRSNRPQCWLMHRLIPMVHYIPAANVKSLPRVLSWCADNDAKCREVAEEGKRYVTSLLVAAEDFAVCQLERGSP